MRIIVACILIVSATDVIAEHITHFYPNGTQTRLSVDSKILEGTPKWVPNDSPVPLSAGDAIAVAKKYHNSLSLSKWARLYRWRIIRTMLISCDDDRGYWIVTYQGTFDATLLGPNSGGHSIECPESIYNHYPVTLSGKMPAPIRLHPDDPKRPPDTVEDLLNMLDSNGEKCRSTGEWPDLNNGLNVGERSAPIVE